MRDSTTILHGDCRAHLATLDAARFRSCVTSPPYWEIVNYLPPDHPDRALELGHEPRPEDYIDELVAVFREVRRVLTDDGTLWLNIGDKYAVKPGGNLAGGPSGGPAGRRMRRGSAAPRLSAGRADRPPKSLLMLPARIAMALQDDGWILRSELIWRKIKFAPHPVDDRPTIAHEPVYLFSKSDRYFYDKDAIRERGTVWDIATDSGGGHEARMPAELARRCLLLGSKIGDEVIDPFGGSGTVGRIAEDESRRATLIDLDERACATARQRTAQISLPASTTE